MDGLGQLNQDIVDPNQLDALKDWADGKSTGVPKIVNGLAWLARLDPKQNDPRVLRFLGQALVGRLDAAHPGTGTKIRERIVQHLRARGVPGSEWQKATKSPCPSTALDWLEAGLEGKDYGAYKDEYEKRQPQLSPKQPPGPPPSRPTDPRLNAHPSTTQEKETNADPPPAPLTGDSALPKAEPAISNSPSLPKQQRPAHTEALSPRHAPLTNRSKVQSAPSVCHGSKLPHAVQVTSDSSGPHIGMPGRTNASSRTKTEQLAEKVAAQAKNVEFSLEQLAGVDLSRFAEKLYKINKSNMSLAAWGMTKLFAKAAQNGAALHFNLASGAEHLSKFYKGWIRSAPTSGPEIARVLLVDLLRDVQTHRNGAMAEDLMTLLTASFNEIAMTTTPEQKCDIENFIQHIRNVGTQQAKTISDTLTNFLQNSRSDGGKHTTQTTVAASNLRSARSEDGKKASSSSTPASRHNVHASEAGNPDDAMGAFEPSHRAQTAARSPVTSGGSARDTRALAGEGDVLIHNSAARGRKRATRAIAEGQPAAPTSKTPEASPSFSAVQPESKSTGDPVALAALGGPSSEQDHFRAGAAALKEIGSQIVAVAWPGSSLRFADMSDPKRQIEAPTSHVAQPTESKAQAKSGPAPSATQTTEDLANSICTQNPVTGQFQFTLESPQQLEGVNLSLLAQELYKLAGRDNMRQIASTVWKKIMAAVEVNQTLRMNERQEANWLSEFYHGWACSARTSNQEATDIAKSLLFEFENDLSHNKFLRTTKGEAAITAQNMLTFSVSALIKSLCKIIEAVGPEINNSIIECIKVRGMLTDTEKDRICKLLAKANSAPSEPKPEGKHG